MPRRLWSDGEEVVQGDLNAASPSLEIELYDRILYELANRQQNILFGDSLVASYINATTSQVKAGNGFYFDNTQVDPEPMTRLFRVATNTNVTHTAADGTFNRIDIICARADRANVQTSTRNFKDPTSGAVTPTSFVVETDWQTTLTVVAGTPSGSPAVPSTPAGYVKLAEVLVTSGSGIAGAGAYTDKRSRFKKPSSWPATKTVTTTYTADLDDEVILANDNAASFSITLPAVAGAVGKKLTIKKLNNSANSVTLQANGAETIDGANTQAISAQYTALTIVSDGSQWFIIA